MLHHIYKHICFPTLFLPLNGHYIMIKIIAVVNAAALRARTLYNLHVSINVYFANLNIKVMLDDSAPHL